MRDSVQIVVERYIAEKKQFVRKAVDLNVDCFIYMTDELIGSNIRYIVKKIDKEIYEFVNEQKTLNDTDQK